MRKIIVMLTVFVLVLSNAGCGGRSDANTSLTEAENMIAESVSSEAQIMSGEANIELAESISSEANADANIPESGESIVSTENIENVTDVNTSNVTVDANPTVGTTATTVADTTKAVQATTKANQTITTKPTTVATQSANITNPTQPATQASKPVPATTKAVQTTTAPKPTVAQTQAPKPTQAQTQAPKPTQAQTQAPKPTQAQTQAPKPTVTPTQAQPVHTHNWTAVYKTVTDQKAYDEQIVTGYYTMLEKHIYGEAAGEPDENWNTTHYGNCGTNGWYIDITGWSLQQCRDYERNHNPKLDNGCLDSCYVDYIEVPDYNSPIYETIHHEAVTHQEIDYYTCSCGATK